VALEAREVRSGILAAGLIAAPLVILVALTAVTSSHDLAILGSDLETYRGYADSTLGGAVPYSDFRLEYPPLALLPMIVPALLAAPAGGDFTAYAGAFALVEGVLAEVAGWLLLRVAPRPIEALATWVVLVAITATSAAWRYDLWPSLLVLAALVATERGRPGLAGIALGAGTAMKLFPIAVVPILAVRAIAAGDRPELWRVLGGAVATLAAVAAGSWVVAGGDALQPLAYQLDRGLQLESVGAGLLLLGNAAGALPAEVVHRFGSLQVVAPGADAVATTSGLVQAALVTAACVLAFGAFRRDARAIGSVPVERTAEATVAVLAALLVGSKVFSIQYVLWILPLVPLLRPSQRVLGALVAVCSTLIYPVGYAGLWQLDPAMIVLLDVRNLLLVGFLAVLLIDLARGTAIASEGDVSRREPRRSPGGAPA
jgi:hypothetical protein